MNDRILVKLRGDREWILLRTVTRENRWSRHTFYISRNQLLRLEQECEVVANDSSDFVVVRRNTDEDTMTIVLYLLNEFSNGTVKGQKQRFVLPYLKVMDFVLTCTEKDVDRECSFLSLPENHMPHIVFDSRKNLRAAVSNPVIRRKLSRFLRDAFQWQRSTEILLFDDFVPYSFCFREMRGSVPGIEGGVILHDQKDLTKAHYSIHT